MGSKVKPTLEVLTIDLGSERVKTTIMDKSPWDSDAML